ncbi:putative tetratricopeptide-like helical domain superfamily [Helianthus anomalus]
MDEAKMVFSEMEENNYSPNLVTCNLLIGGLCRHGLVNETLKYKKSMIVKGLVPDKYTYAMIIDGLCKARFSNPDRCGLSDRSGLDPKDKAGLSS